MATLVLTAVGTVLGGPLGGALGAMLGQSADALLFAPKSRQGPRLSDLKIQTSSYGDAIPRLYGIMRVAGTVIWASDLIEQRQARSGGKGRPKTIDYRYSASFAVALSARRIGAIRRIWADGRLLRDETGRFAENVIFRSYLGDADQPADPLIASAVGPDRASGFREIAYAMFETLDLSAFGNRIPQLSFEVEADAGPIDVGLVGNDLLPGGVALGGPAMAGYAATNGRVRDALAPLVGFADLKLQTSGSRSILGGRNWTIDGLADGGAAAVHSGAELRADDDRRTPLSRVPRQLVLRHFDPGRDFQTSQQSADVAGGGGPFQIVELPCAMTPDDAQAHVGMLARSAIDARRVVHVRAGMGALTLPLGQILTLDIAEIEGQNWRIAERRVEGAAVILTLVLQSNLSPTAQQVGDGGQAITSASLPGLDANVVVFDVPGDGEVPNSFPTRMVAAAGGDAGWRGADLWWADGAGIEPEPIGRISQAAALGTIDHQVASAASWLIDWANSIEVTLAHDAMELTNVAMGALIAGGNLAMVGDEAVQFMRATPLGGRRWRLAGLLRERGGSFAPAPGHPVGTAFLLLGDAALVSLPNSMARRAALSAAAIDWQARGGDVMQRVTVPAGQRALLPLSPVHGRAARAANGDAIIAWTPRSRAGAPWRDGVAVPTGETAVTWLLSWADPLGAPKTKEVAASPALLEAGTFAPATWLTVVQRGDYGLSAARNILLPE